jgi:hypothetical protein
MGLLWSGKHLPSASALAGAARQPRMRKTYCVDRWRLAVVVGAVLAGAVPATAAPTAADFEPVVVTVTVRDESGAAMASMHVSAVSHDYGFRLEGTSNASGTVQLDLMVGEWSFFATPTWDRLWTHQGKGYYLVKSGQVISSASNSLTLEPTTQVQLQVSSSVFDFTGRDALFGFVAQPFGKYIQARYAGVVHGTELVLHTAPGLSGRAYVGSFAPGDVDLFFTGEEAALTSPLAMHIDQTNSSVIELDATYADGSPAISSVLLFNKDLTWTWSHHHYQDATQPHRIRVSAHGYDVRPSVVSYNAASEMESMVFNPVYFDLSAGETRRLPLGGSVQPHVIRTTPRSYEVQGGSNLAQVMTLFSDEHQNFLQDRWEHGIQVRPQVVVHHGGGTSDVFDSYMYGCACLEEEFDRAEDPMYEVSWDFGSLWGSGTLTGPLYGTDERRMHIDETRSLLSQAPRYEHGVRQGQVGWYQQIADSMETALGVPIDYKQGVISNIKFQGMQDEVQSGYKLEIGVEFENPIGDPLLNASAAFSAHEAGHGHTLLPPMRFGAVREYGEAYSTLIAVKAGTLLYGGEEYMHYYMGYWDRFLRLLHGQVIVDVYDLIDTMQFVTTYVYAHYGWEPHRRMIVEWSNAFLPLQSALQAPGYTDVEQFAIVYSWLVGEDLGVLFETAELIPDATRVAGGLTVIDDYFSAVTSPSLRLGPNTIRAPRTSIPVQLEMPPGGSATDLEFVLQYDPTKARFERTYLRDLTYASDWTISTQVDRTAGTILARLRGSTPIEGLGSVAQFSFALLPGAAGALPFSLSNGSVGGVSVSDDAHSLVIPTDLGLFSEVVPLIGPFPNLPSGMPGQSYSTTLWATAGSPPYTWAVVEDVLPPGLALSPGGVISGQPSTLGEYMFRVRCQDSAGREAHRWYTIRVVDSALNLEVTKTGSGAGTVVSSPPGISCSPTCSATFPEGGPVQLAAHPDHGSSFLGWSGDADCNDGVLTIRQASSCTADFGLEDRRLEVSVTGAGDGTVTSSPPGISCGADCREDYPFGWEVDLHAMPELGSELVGYAGDTDCADGVVELTEDRICEASFGPCTIDSVVDLPATVVAESTGFEACNILSAIAGFEISSGAEVTFRAGNEIILGDGFQVDTGALFIARIGPN